MADPASCLVQVSTPPPSPQRPKGLQLVPLGTVDVPKVIQIINNNYAVLNKLIQDFQAINNVLNQIRSGRYVEDKEARVVTDVRVENPDDAEQYVNIKRIDRVVMRAPGGGTWTWNR